MGLKNCQVFLLHPVLHTFVSEENLKSFVANDPGVCYCMLLLVNATSFEKGCSTAKELP